MLTQYQFSPFRKDSKETWVLHNKPLLSQQTELYYSGSRCYLRFLMDGGQRERNVMLSTVRS